MYFAALLTFFYKFSLVIWVLVLISHCAFSLCAIFNPNQNKLIAMIIMINITIIGTYPLKQLISRKLEMNVDNELKFSNEFSTNINQKLF